MRLRFALLVALALALAACGEGGSADLDRPPPAPEERLADWERQPEGTAVPVALGFEHPLPDSTIAALLTRHSVRPYAVYLVAAGMGSSLRRDRIRASLEVLGEAREQAMSQLRTSLCAQPGRTRAMLERPSGTEGLERERQMLLQMAALQRSVPELEMGAPVIYRVEAVGSIADVRALRDEPAVVSWEPGWRGQIRGTDTVGSAAAARGHRDRAAGGFGRDGAQPGRSPRPAGRVDHDRRGLVRGRGTRGRAQVIRHGPPPPRGAAWSASSLER